MDKILQGIETIIFCDESKFYRNNGDVEDAIYYFGVSVEKRQVPKIHKAFSDVLLKYRVQSKVYHSTTVFKESRPRPDLMNEITNVIIGNKLQCFCYKYAKLPFFGPTKNLGHLNNDIINFDRDEFQALFYFLMILNTYLRDGYPALLKREISMYFDRNVYGIQEIEAFKFPNEHFVIQQMTFSEKSRISLLALPDFLGYIFRKSKQSQNKVQFGDHSIETSPLTINSYKCLADLHTNKLFRFLEVNESVLFKALNIQS